MRKLFVPTIGVGHSCRQRLSAPFRSAFRLILFPIFSTWVFANALANPTATPESRAQGAAIVAIESLPPGIHLIVTQDDGDSAVVAKAIATFPVDRKGNLLEKNSSHGKSWVRFSGRVSFPKNTETLILNGKMNVRVDFESSRKIAKGAVGEFIADESEFKDIQLSKGAPYIVAFNRTTNAPEAAEKFSEASSLLLIWK